MVSFDLENLHKHYADIYRHILRHIYPAKNSTGFPERNLSVNFSKAYEDMFIGEGCFTWFELQFGEKNNLHYDACIVDENNKRIIIIESKRFSNLKKKIAEIGEDIDRLQNIKKIEMQELRDRIPQSEFYEIYGLILADAWKKTREKRNIIQSFIDSSFIEKYSDELCVQDKPDDVSYYSDLVKEFNNNSYYLLSFIWRVK